MSSQTTILDQIFDRNGLTCVGMQVFHVKGYEFKPWFWVIATFDPNPGNIVPSRLN